MRSFLAAVVATMLGVERDKIPFVPSSDLPKRVAVRVVTLIELPKPALAIGKAQLWIPVPRDDEHQLVQEVLAPGSPRWTRDPALGNRFLYYEYSPASQLPSEITVQADVVRSVHVTPTDQPNPDTLDAKELAPWMQPNRLVPIDASVKILTDDIVRGAASDSDRALRIYHHVFSYMSYDKSEPGWGNADFERARNVGKGDCTDFHGMFLAMCRSQKIPARFEIGVELATDGSNAVPGDYHCWAACHIAGAGWVPVDISSAWKRFRAAGPGVQNELKDRERRYGFGSLDAFRVTYSRGLDVLTAPPSSAPLRYLIDPVLELDGNRVPIGDPKAGGCRRTWSYTFVE